MRNIEEEDFAGKTVKSVKRTSVNVLAFTFTDDTSVELWAEWAINTPYGPIAGIFVEDNPDTAHSDCDESCSHG